MLGSYVNSFDNAGGKVSKVLKKRQNLGKGLWLLSVLVKKATPNKKSKKGR